MFRQLKPETQQRRARERAANREERRRILVDRLREKAAGGDPDGLWAELLAEAEARLLA